MRRSYRHIGIICRKW